MAKRGMTVFGDPPRPRTVPTANGGQDCERWGEAVHAFSPPGSDEPGRLKAMTCEARTASAFVLGRRIPPRTPHSRKTAWSRIRFFYAEVAPDRSRKTAAAAATPDRANPVR